ncbi:hypothetical protein Slin15195_G077630 [Septoria linicola]|uniref:Uncharacterized protein n=1 Tax=Septoria linicola TaxID=215465 RepID=A0A9Q9ATI8_9PEZI|nr:hypothetical protein Slin14017_G038810 [Septoria linicola]USW54444.1 hypothetical protein Slin15195_G077630 [Septoria linicola]
MAAPAEVNVHNIAGSYDLNKNISDSTGAMLKMQNIGFIVRQAANYSAIQVNLTQYKGDDGLLHVDQEQISTGNVKQLEPRILDGETRERDIQYWGKVSGWNKYVKLAEVTQDAFLTQDWDQECKDGDVLLSYTESVGNGWTAVQVWGFATVDGVRRHVRRIYSKKGKEEHRIRLVYDYKGPTPASS